MKKSACLHSPFLNLVTMLGGFMGFLLVFWINQHKWFTFILKKSKGREERLSFRLFGSSLHITHIQLGLKGSGTGKTKCWWALKGKGAIKLHGHSKYHQMIGTNRQGKISEIKTSDRQPQTDLLSLLYLCKGGCCKGSKKKAWTSELLQNIGTSQWQVSPLRWMQ